MPMTQDDLLRLIDRGEFTVSGLHRTLTAAFSPLDQTASDLIDEISCRYFFMQSSVQDNRDIQGALRNRNIIKAAVTTLFAGMAKGNRCPAVLP